MLLDTLYLQEVLKNAKNHLKLQVEELNYLKNHSFIRCVNGVWFDINLKPLHYIENSIQHGYILVNEKPWLESPYVLYTFMITPAGHQLLDAA